jgi:hypothetical protein
VIPPRIFNLVELRVSSQPTIFGFHAIELTQPRQVLSVQNCALQRLPREIFTLSRLLALDPRGNPLTSPPRALCEDIFYGAGRLAAHGGSAHLAQFATAQLRSYDVESQRLLFRRPDLAGAQTAFCPGCFAVGFWRGGVFAPLCQVPLTPGDAAGRWRAELREKAACGKCAMGVEALLVLGAEITCACRTHIGGISCLDGPDLRPRDRYAVGRIFD